MTVSGNCVSGTPQTTYTVTASAGGATTTVTVTTAYDAAWPMP